jgi:hypothetical protein
VTNADTCNKIDGYTWNGSKCVVDSGGTAPTIDEQTECTSGGGQWIENTCVKEQKDCEALTEKGYTWDEEKQQCVQGDGNDDNEENCTKSGYSWIDGKCITDEGTCDKLGYTWNEKTKQCTPKSGEGETYNDKESCTKAGYYWSEEYGVCLMYKDKEACQKAKYQWYENKSICITNQTICEKLTGKWNSKENKCEI